MKKKLLALFPVHTDDEYRKALKLAEAVFDGAQEPDPESEEGRFFEALLTLVEAYETKHYSMAPPDPIDAIKFRMEQQGLTPKDLKPMIGGLNRVYEVLARTRPLSINMVRRLHTGLGIPAETLIRETA